jgi:hypothetical protein
MGNTQSLTPSTINTCTDAGDLESDNVPIKNFCEMDGQRSYNETYCTYYGGTYPTGPPPNSSTYSYPEPEWVMGNIPSRDNCLYDDSNLPNEMTAPGCNGGCAITGGRGYCTRVKNTGDPLICLLRDYQCNGNNEKSSSYCFSDNNLASTCSKDFRATDTAPSNYLVNQFCLGNIPGSIDNLDPKGFSFFQLWTDNNNSTNTNNQVYPWVVLNTPEGTKYRTSANIEQQATCNLDLGGNPTNCTLSTWFPGPGGTGTVDPFAPTQYPPQPDSYQFQDGIAPCQQLFWRTLYGNQPMFKNNFYAPFGTTATCPDGSSICDNTSIPPQQAACGAIPFNGEPTDVGLANAQYMLESAVKKYISTGASMTDESANGGSIAFQSWVYQVCQTYPNLCKNILEDTICNGISQEEILNDPYKLQWCGCYLSPESYGEYNTIGVSQECTPFCNRPDVIPLVDPDTGNPKYCQQSVCIIDDVTITLARSKLESQGLGGGNLNFNQICNSCSASADNGTNSNTLTSSNSVNASTTSEGVVNNNVSINCQCILKNFTLTTVGASIEGGINISQACNGNAKCYSSGSSSGGNLLEVDCHGSSTSQNTIIAKAEAALIEKAKNTSSYWVIFFIIVLIGLIIITWLIIAPRGVPEENMVINKRFDLPSPPSIPVIRPVYQQPPLIGYMNRKMPFKPKFY